ncbi:DoxX family protein [Echinicola jeungdonensis]|uniref:DoxX family protein n=1 Tax=Echinicola jeungdonensis TaxID=709343 RepID=A0ABV5J526_9BACT|nr:DoxX family protein [Echinicola jeungdonensis]MDN3669568.1 DoxX family protein [Echinicola jeungdonensis]
MNTISKIESWADTHHPRWIDFIRVALGLFILYKGIMFISNTQPLMEMMANIDLQFFNLALAHYVAFAHLVGGFFIALGLLTRFSIVFQIPILIGAVFFVNIDQGFLSVANNMEFEISLIVLVLLIVFLIYGSGKFSLDYWMKNHPYW